MKAIIFLSVIASAFGQELVPLSYFSSTASYQRTFPETNSEMADGLFVYATANDDVALMNQITVTLTNTKNATVKTTDTVGTVSQKYFYPGQSGRKAPIGSDEFDTVTVTSTLSVEDAQKLKGSLYIAKMPIGKYQFAVYEQTAAENITVHADTWIVFLNTYKDRPTYQSVPFNSMVRMQCDYPASIQAFYDVPDFSLNNMVYEYNNIDERCHIQYLQFPTRAFHFHSKGTFTFITSLDEDVFQNIFFTEGPQSAGYLTYNYPSTTDRTLSSSVNYGVPVNMNMKIIHNLNPDQYLDVQLRFYNNETMVLKKIISGNGTTSIVGIADSFHIDPSSFQVGAYAVQYINIDPSTVTTTFQPPVTTSTATRIAQFLFAILSLSMVLLQ